MNISFVHNSESSGITNIFDMCLHADLTRVAQHDTMMLRNTNTQRKYEFGRVKGDIQRRGLDSTPAQKANAREKIRLCSVERGQESETTLCCSTCSHGGNDQRASNGEAGNTQKINAGYHQRNSAVKRLSTDWNPFDNLFSSVCYRVLIMPQVAHMRQGPGSTRMCMPVHTLPQYNDCCNSGGAT